MAFKSSYRLQPCRLSKLDAGGISWGSRLQWPSTPPTTCSRADYPSWTLEGRQLWVTTTNGLQVFLPLAAVSIAQVGSWSGVSWGHGYKWLSSILITYSCAGYPRWVLEGRQLEVTTTNSLQIFLSPTAVPVTQARPWGDVNWGL